MQSKSMSAIALAYLALAAVGGCADARSNGESSGAGPGGELEVEGAGASELCPRKLPMSGTPCRLPPTMSCTYHGDRPCSRTYPDRIAACCRPARQKTRVRNEHVTKFCVDE